MNVAIAGYGIEGEQNYQYFSALGHTVTIVDEREDPIKALPAEASVLLGPGSFEKLDGFDLVIRTAGLAPRKIKTDGKIWSATNEFFAQCHAPIIGVTGTKGKGTTASLITSILRASGRTVHLVGNIGVPALSVLSVINPEDIVVYELSSFQLWDLEKSPHTAVVLMIEPDHLDVHTDMNEYIVAKSQIATHQQSSDVVLYHPANKYSKMIAEASSGKKIRYAMNESVYIKDDQFFTGQEAICPVSALQIPGEHNQENACAAIAATLISGARKDSVEAGLREFTGLPHRLKLVREWRGVQFYDDSIATTPGSAIAAMKSFNGRKVLILGGSDKGASYDEVVSVAKLTDTQVVAIGQTGERIADLCRSQGVTVTREIGHMPEVVKVALKQADGDGVVLLSPASASFDQYKSYSDRGDQFVKAVEELS